MSMVVQHNLQAMNSNRMLGITTGAQSKSTEKLSSGYRINRAADDAAGLTISEKMRKQMRGLDRASTNAQDGVSAVQTAEGALTEVHSMLQRMNELAVQSANGTNSQSDRDAIQAEIDQLYTEIDRVAETTKFNEIYLLKGDDESTKDVYSYKSSVPVEASFEFGATTTLYKADGTQITTEEDAIEALEADEKLYKADPTASAATAGTDYTAASMALGAVSTYADGSDTAIAAGALATYFEVAADGTVSMKAGAPDLYTDTDANGQGASKKVGSGSNTDLTKYVTGTAAKWTADLYDSDGEKIEDDAGLIAALKAGKDLFTAAPELADDYTYTPAGNQRAQFYDDDGKEVAASKISEMLENGDNLYADKAQATAVTTANIATYTDKTSVNGDLSFNLHVGADSPIANKITVTIAHMSSAGIGLGAKLDVSSEDAATAAIDIISDAIQTVSTQRSDLGAIQNRLEHTIANLDNVVENTTAAESRIRDTDMAKEMVEYSKNNILAQAGQSMLAQANQSTQGVLSLLG